MPNQLVSSTLNIRLYKCFEVGHLLDHMGDDWTFFKSMYNFINNGIVGKSSSHNFRLHCPKDASISSYAWPTKRKDTNASLKMPFATNNYQYAKTYLLLLSFAKPFGWWVQGYFQYVPTMKRGLGRPTQTLWQEGFKIIFNTSPLWKGVWVNWPKPCGKMLSRSCLVRPLCGQVFGSTDPNPLAWWVQGYFQYDTLWAGVWVDQPKCCVRMRSRSSIVCRFCRQGFGSTDPNNPQNPPI